MGDVKLPENALWQELKPEFDAPKMVGICLKHGRTFVEVFLKHAMPLLDRMFRTNKDDVIGLIKTLQQSTRFLQTVCNHSKVQKNVSLTNSVPPLRKALETFVLRVKAMLALNRCKEAFWLGNLKNRNLQGEEILSQVSNEGTDEDDDGDVVTEDSKEDSNVSGDDSDGSHHSRNNADSDEQSDVSESY